ncbi:MAG: hypothetical protein IKT68_01880 [Clostridia bacterium]|nr:hypothetical protein [Clostridia bacterium]
MTKRIVSMVLAVVIVCLSMCCGVSAETLTQRYPTGLLPSESGKVSSLFSVDSTFMKGYNDFVFSKSKGNDRSSRGVFPDEIDLSTDIYFPPIVNQRGASCSSYSTTYYQFTYAKNELLGTNANSTNNRCSPAWTYSHLNYNDMNQFTSFEANYNILKTLGAPSCAEVPISTDYYFTNWSTSVQMRRNALEVRLKDYYNSSIDTASSPITSYDDSDLYTIKYLLCNGYVLVTSTLVTSNASNYTYGNSPEFGKIVYRASNSGTGHALTIVGYNDWVCFDVNGNGTIEDCEYGAFKVANSWGEDWGNDGYIWVLYDALNSVSQIPTFDESDFPGNRTAIFDYGFTEGENVFYYINVVDTKPMFLGEISINTDDRSTLSSTFMYLLKDEMGDETSVSIPSPYGYKNGSIPYNGPLVIAFNNIPIDSVDDDRSLLTYINLFINNQVDTATVSYRITDNLGNVIYEHTNGNNDEWTITRTDRLSVNKNFVLSQRGDVDFDGLITNSDAQLVLGYVVGSQVLSNAQLYFADYTKDGTVNATDALEIKKNLTA